jgi:hypothetical protein
MGQLPVLGSREVIAPLLLRQIVKDIRSTPEDFLRYR